MAAVWRAEAIKGRSGRHGRGCGAVPGVPPGSSDGPAGVFGRAVCDGSSQVAKAGGGVRQVLAGTGKGSGLVIAGALVSWLADGANEKRNCVGALLVVLSALCHARDVWISLPGPQAAVVLSRQVVGLADDLRRMGVDVDARALWRMLRWSARHGMSMRARSPLDLGVTPETERQAAFDLWVAQRGRVG